MDSEVGSILLRLPGYWVTFQTFFLYLQAFGMFCEAYLGTFTPPPTNFIDLQLRFVTNNLCTTSRFWMVSFFISVVGWHFKGYTRNIAHAQVLFTIVWVQLFRPSSKVTVNRQERYLFMMYNELVFASILGITLFSRDEPMGIARKVLFIMGLVIYMAFTHWAVYYDEYVKSTPIPPAPILKNPKKQKKGKKSLEPEKKLNETFLTLITAPNMFCRAARWWWYAAMAWNSVATAYAMMVTAYCVATALQKHKKHPFRKTHKAIIPHIL